VPGLRRPGITPAHSLRADGDDRILSQTV